MKDKLITFLINEKDNLWEELEDTLYFDPTQSTYKPLTTDEITKINNLRKDIFDIYNLIDRIGDMI